MFQSALATAKRVRTETGIGAGRTSVSSVAVDLARHVFRSFNDKTVLTIGAGKMTELTLQYFMELKPQTTLVCNRTLSRAEELAAKFGVSAVPFDNLDDHLVAADVVISSTGATQPIVTAERFKQLVKRRRFRPIYIVDIAVPRDFEAAVGELAGVYLYNLDDLQASLAEQAAARSTQVVAAEAIIEPAVADCYAGVQTGDFNDLIRKLREHLHELGALESQRTINKLKTAKGDDLERILDEHTQRLINKILHRPMSELGRNRSAPAAMYATALRRLFDLGESGEDMEQPEATEPRES
jgi:glutamyl-tRNA reductase